jgi:hypothetical protein
MYVEQPLGFFPGSAEARRLAVADPLDLAPMPQTVTFVVSGQVVDAVT